MKYISTRNKNNKKSFCEVLLEGLAEDGGLFVPEHFPQIDKNTLNRWKKLNYADLAYEILSLYVDDIPKKDLKNICKKSYTKKIFGTADITPVRKLNSNISFLELSNGPTCAFKDMAMQLLGNLFEYELKRQKRKINILGATSGDTGSAAEYALKGKKNINVFMLSPEGRMSEFQKAQMYSLKDKNIFNITINGTFDDCQDIVKKINSGNSFKQKYDIGAVNSINVARVLIQAVYYFYGYFRATKNSTEKINFSVPTGNFGDIYAGFIAKMMGLPVNKLILATNENDVLNVFFKKGIYTPRSSEKTYKTSSPSMDISKASNFERFIFDLFNRDDAKTKELFVKGSFNIAKTKEFKTLKNKFGFLSGKSTHANRLKSIKEVYSKYKQLIDTHTADAYKVAKDFKLKERIVVLETALPIKFEDTVKEALGFAPKKDKKFVKLEKLKRYYVNFDNDPEKVKKYIVKNSSIIIR
jgi:threonine synthase